MADSARQACQAASASVKVCSVCVCACVCVCVCVVHWLGLLTVCGLLSFRFLISFSVGGREAQVVGCSPPSCPKVSKGMV